MSNPIPLRFIEEFKSYMDAHDNDDLSDGAWFQMLEDAAQQFMNMYNIKGSANDAAHQYINSLV